MTLEVVHWHEKLAPARIWRRIFGAISGAGFWSVSGVLRKDFIFLNHFTKSKRLQQGRLGCWQNAFPGVPVHNTLPNDGNMCRNKNTNWTATN